MFLIAPVFAGILAAFSWGQVGSGLSELSPLGSS